MAFQFQSGAVKRNLRDSLSAIHGGFNSKVVRLKARLDFAFVLRLNRFQFQSGAVKSVAAFIPFCRVFEFQFQSGAVKS